jgi:hypothetical protein
VLDRPEEALVLFRSLASNPNTPVGRFALHSLKVLEQP